MYQLRRGLLRRRMAGSGRVGGCVVALLERQRRSLGSQDSAFPPDVIMVSVRRYLRYGLSYRDVEELLAERGIKVDHVTVYRWVQRFTPAADRRGTTLSSRGRKSVVCR